MSALICISAGQLQTKKIDNAINRRHRYLNYGLLSLASVLHRGGYEPVVIHGHFDSPDSVLSIAERRGLVKDSPCVLISLPSFYAVGWASEFMAKCRSRYPLVKFIVGGRWVVGSSPAKLKELLPYADCIVPGLAEEKILELVRGRINLVRQSENSKPTVALNALNYRLLHDRSLYQPSIEVSRGCGMGCSFCQERDERLQPLKSPERLVEELKSVLLVDDLAEMTPYFEASMFVPTRDWSARFSEALEHEGLTLKWRTEGRVDNIRADLIPALAQAGLTVLDLGLESASPLQLQRMKKTRAPQSYLRQADELIDACNRAGVKVKVNLLMFAGETDETLAETVKWIGSRQDGIAGASVGPVIAYGWPDEASGYISELSEWGASVHNSPCHGVYNMNLSDAFPHERALLVGREVSRRFMSADQYFFLKSFSYFGRDYRKQDFLRDVADAPDDLSFDTSALRLRG